MTVDREQVRRGALTKRERNWLGDQGQAQIEVKFDALLAELEQAKRREGRLKRDRESALCRAEQAERERDKALVSLLKTGSLGEKYALEAHAMDAQLAAVPALVEALRRIAETSRWYADNGQRLAHEVDHALCVEIVSESENALSAYEQAQEKR